MRIIGIDPGVSGAVSLVTEGARYLVVHDMPTMQANKTGDKKQINVVELGKILRTILLENPDVRAIMERVQPMPSIPGADGQRRGMGAASAFTFGKSVGHIEAAILVLGIPVEFVMPAQWKRGMGLTANKEAARALAQQCFPEAPLARVKDQGRAEALLIAKWFADRERIGTARTSEVDQRIAQNAGGQAF